MALLNFACASGGTTTGADAVAGDAAVTDELASDFVAALDDDVDEDCIDAADDVDDAELLAFELALLDTT